MDGWKKSTDGQGVQLHKLRRIKVYDYRKAPMVGQHLCWVIMDDDGTQLGSGFATTLRQAKKESLQAEKRVQRPQKWRVKVIVDVMSCYMYREVEARTAFEAETKARGLCSDDIQEFVNQTVDRAGWEVEVESVSEDLRDAHTVYSEEWDQFDPAQND